MSADWFRIEMTPAPHPFEELEAALVRVAAEAPTALLDLLLAPGGVRRAVHRVLPDDHGQLLLVIDQFEELFTQVDDDTANRFIDELVDARHRAGHPGPRRHHAARRLLRPSAAASGPRRAAPGRHRGDHTDVDRRARGGDHRPGRQGRRGRRAARRVGDGGRGRRPAGRPPAAAVHADRAVRRPSRPHDHDRRLPRRRRRVADAGPPGRLAARRARPGDHRDGPARAPAAGQPRRRRQRRRDPTARPGRRGRGAGRSRPGPAGARHVRAAPAAELRSRPRHARSDGGDLPRGAADGVDHAARLDRRCARRPAHAPPPRRRDERVDGRRPLTRLPPARRTARHDRGVGRVRPRWGCDRRSTSTSMPAWRRAPRSNGSARRTSSARPTPNAGPGAAPANWSIGALAMALVVGLATFAWVQRQDARQAEADLTANQAGQRLATLSVNTLSTDPELALLLAKEAVAATADRGYALPEAIDAIHWALQELGVQYDVTPDTPTAARFGPGGVRGVWVLPVERADEPRRRGDRRERSPSRSAAGTSTPPAARRPCPWTSSTSAARTPTPMPCRSTRPRSSSASRTTPTRRASGSATSMPSASSTASPSGCNGSRSTRRRVDAEPPWSGTPMSTCSTAPRSPRWPLPARCSTFGPFIDEAQLLDDYGSFLVSSSRVGERRHVAQRHRTRSTACPSTSTPRHWSGPRNPSSPSFGYPAPTDWASFMALADAIVADGRTPFCLGLESGGFSDGWPATDWVEMVVLRTAGPEFYDAWSRHDVPFDDPVVVEAIRTIGDMVHRPGFLDTTPEDCRGSRLQGRAVRLHPTAGGVPDDAVPERACPRRVGADGRHLRRQLPVPRPSGLGSTTPSWGRRLRRRGHRPPGGPQRS